MTTSNNIDASSLLNVAAVARLLGVSTRTVRRRIADGELRAVRLGDGPHAPVRLTPGAIVAFVQLGRTFAVDA